MTLFGLPPEQWLPLVFASLMGIAILAYVVLDGYDLGVGILMGLVDRPDRDVMVGSIGPFWDANETWLVLGIGLLLVAFPMAHGIILTALYLPVALMLLGLTLRGVAFEFRVKAHAEHQIWWDRAFVAGSLLATVTQGMMLGSYIMGFEQSWRALAFSLLTGLGLIAAYGFLGAAWLIFKTEGELQAKAVGWARKALVGTGAGMAAISLATPLVSERIFRKWFAFPEIILLAPIPLMAGLIMFSLWIFLKRMPRADHSLDLVPFAGGLTLFLLGFAGLAYSFFPYVVPDKLTIFEAASAPESLIIILAGALVVLPVIVAYSAFAYWVFRGKASALKYE
jgi:cytochrome bd ubiquinol oxidase subunit II